MDFSTLSNQTLPVLEDAVVLMKSMFFTSCISVLFNDSIDPSYVRLPSAFALLVAPVDVSILLSPGLEIVLNPVPDVPVEPDVPLVPLIPDVPDDPLVPSVPDVPDDPLVPSVPDVPDDPLVPDDPDVPDVPDDPLVPSVPDVPDEPLSPDDPELPLEPVMPFAITDQ